MLVAEGAAEAMVESELKIWDLAGPRAVLQHAGARLTDMLGGDDMPDRGVVATNGHIHDEVLAGLKAG
jgi:histidinol-phosphatase